MLSANRAVVNLGLGVLPIAGPVIGGLGHHDAVEVDFVGLEQRVDEGADVVALEVGRHDGALPYTLLLLEGGTSSVVEACVEVRIRYVRGHLHGKVRNRISKDVMALNPELLEWLPEKPLFGQPLSEAQCSSAARGAEAA